MRALRDRLGAALRIADQLSGPPEAPFGNHSVTERYIRVMIKLRRHRDSFFGNELFADPAWDMLLELYASALGQLRVTVSSLCLAAAVPATTALRWITLLEAEGLIERRPDPIDGRRKFISLSEKALDAMNGYFRTVPVSASLV